MSPNEQRYRASINIDLSWNISKFNDEDKQYKDNAQ